MTGPTAMATTEGSSSPSNSADAAVDLEERIQKAVKFWKHPSVAAVPSKEKMNYLTSKGLSESDIHLVWEALVQDDDEGAQPAASITAAPPTTGAPPTLSALPQRTALRDDDDYYYDEPPPLKNLALLAVGGMLGLTAAATVRWLNGGDFAIFPPAIDGSYKTSTFATTPSGRGLQEEEEHNRADEGEERITEEYEDGYGGEEGVDVSEISMQMEALSELVKVQSVTQEQILKQLTTQQTKQATDQSMAFLRKNANDRKTSMELLMEIKELLEQLQQQESSSGIANEALDKLNKYFTQIEEEEATISDSPPSNQSMRLVAGTPSSGSPHATASNTTHSSHTTSNSEPVDPSLLLHQVIQRLALENDDRDVLQSGCQVLYLYVVHLSSHPHVPRYRKIYTSNDSFQRVEKLNGGLDLLLAVGFVETDGFLEWQPEQETEALQMLKEASAALSILKSAASREQNSKQTLSRDALATLPPLPQQVPSKSATPTPPDNGKGDKMSQVVDESGHQIQQPWQTPRTPNVATFLVSPPNPKRDPFLPIPHNFPDTPTGEMGMSVLNEASREDAISILDSSFEDALSPAAKLIFDSSNLSPTEGVATNTAAFQPILPKMQLAIRNSPNDSNIIDHRVVEDGGALNTSLIQQQPLLSGGMHAEEVMDDDNDDE